MGSDLVLVTGASGYFVGHCILRLLTDGYKARGTLRSLKRAGEVRQLVGYYWVRLFSVGANVDLDYNWRQPPQGKAVT